MLTCSERIRILEGHLENAISASRWNDRQYRARIFDLESDNTRLRAELSRAMADIQAALPPIEPHHTAAVRAEQKSRTRIVCVHRRES